MNQNNNTVNNFGSCQMNQNNNNNAFMEFMKKMAASNANTQQYNNGFFSFLFHEALGIVRKLGTYSFEVSMLVFAGLLLLLPHTPIFDAVLEEKM